jgi:hypothetical protein
LLNTQYFEYLAPGITLLELRIRITNNKRDRRAINVPFDSIFVGTSFNSDWGVMSDMSKLSNHYVAK